MEGSVYFHTIADGDLMREVNDRRIYLYALRLFGRIYPSEESICLKVFGHRPCIYLGTAQPLTDASDESFIHDTFTHLLTEHSTVKAWNGKIYPAEHHVPYTGYRRTSDRTRFWKIDFPTQRNLDMFVRDFWFLTLVDQNANRNEHGAISYRICCNYLAREVGKCGMRDGFQRWSTSASLRACALGLYTGGFKGGSVSQYSIACIQHNLKTAGWIEFRRGERDSWRRYTCDHEVSVHISCVSVCTTPPCPAIPLRIVSLDIEVFPRHPSFPEPTRNWRYIEQFAQPFLHRWRKRMDEAVSAFHQAHPHYPRRTFGGTASTHAHNLFADKKTVVDTAILSENDVRTLLAETADAFQWESEPLIDAFLAVAFSARWRIGSHELDEQVEQFDPNKLFTAGKDDDAAEDADDAAENDADDDTTDPDESDVENEQRIAKRKTARPTKKSRKSEPPPAETTLAARARNCLSTIGTILTDYHSPWYQPPSAPVVLGTSSGATEWTDSDIYQCFAYHWWTNDLGAILGDPISYVNMSIGNHMQGTTERDISLTWNVAGRPDTRGVIVENAPNLELVVCHSERDLLMQLATRFKALDADILVGHNISSFDNSYLAARARVQGVERVLLEAFTRQAPFTSANSTYEPHMVCKQTFIKGMNVDVEWFPGVGMLQIDTLIWSRKNRPYPTHTLDYISQVNLGDKIIDARVVSDESSGADADAACLEITAGSSDIVQLHDYVTLLKAKFMIEVFSPKWVVVAKGPKWLRLRPTSIEATPAAIGELVTTMRALTAKQSTFSWGMVKDDMPIEQMRAYTISTNPRERGLVAKYCAQDCHLPIRLLHRLGIVFEFLENAVINTVSVEDIMSRGQNARLSACCTRFALQRPVPVQFEEWRRPPRTKTVNRVKKYEGAIVLGPDVGNYLDCATVDFNSLYPSLQSELETDGSTIIYAEYLEFVHPETAQLPTPRQVELHAKLVETNGDPATVNAVMDEWIPPLDGAIADADRGFYALKREVHYNEALWTELRATEPTGYFAEDSTATSNVITRPRWCPQAWRATGTESVRCNERNFITAEKDVKKRRILGVVRVYSISTTHRYHPRVNAVNAAIIPALGNIFMDMRKQVRKLQKKFAPGSVDYQILEGQQLGFKGNSNSLYGCSGDQNSKFYNPEHAPCVTSAGRKSILFTADTVRRVSSVHCHIGFYAAPAHAHTQCVACNETGTFGAWCCGKTQHRFAPTDATKCSVCAEKLKHGPNWVVCANGHYTHESHESTACAACGEMLEAGQHRRPIPSRFYWLEDRPVAAATTDNWADADWLVAQFRACLADSPFERLSWDRSCRYRRGLQMVEQINGFIRFQKAYLAAPVEMCEGRPMRRVRWEQPYRQTAAGVWEYYMALPGDVERDAESMACVFPIDECRDIYGDTDSVFFKAQMAHMTATVGEYSDRILVLCAVSTFIARAVSFMLGAPMNLEFEKHEGKLMLVSKKRYYACILKPGALEDFEMMCQGLQVKKRDTAEACRNMQGLLNDAMVLEHMKIGEALAEIERFEARLKANEIPLAQLAISRPLRATYKKPESIPQWVLANRIGRMDPGRQPKPGETMQIVHVVPVGAESWTLKEIQARVRCGDRIELVDTVRERDLRPNLAYYLVNQVFRPLCSTTLVTVDPEGFFRYFREESLWEQTIQPTLKRMAVRKYNLQGMRDNDYVMERIKLLSEFMMQVLTRKLIRDAPVSIKPKCKTTTKSMRKR